VLDVAHLRSFVQVAERGTVAAAAAAMGYTAPAVSQHVAKLERSLDVALFDRVAGRLRPSRAGRALLPLAHQMLDLAERCQRVVHAEPAPTVTIVAGLASALAEILAPLLHASGPRPEITIIDAEDSEALRELSLGQVDIALVQEYDRVPTTRDRRFTYQPVARDELRLVLPPHLPATTTLADLDGAPWLMNGTGTRCADAIARILAGAGIEPLVVGSISDNHALLALVAAGHGASIVPALVLHHVERPVTVAEQTFGSTRTVLAVTRHATTAGHQQLIGQLTRA
jgi:DNA-binding transcriptional LysR family regulator